MNRRFFLFLLFAGSLVGALGQVVHPSQRVMIPFDSPAETRADSQPKAGAMGYFEDPVEPKAVPEPFGASFLGSLGVFAILRRRR
jgi:hypothetical protein